jgi:hypothetical protein
MARFTRLQVQKPLIESEAAGATVTNKLTLAATGTLTVGDYVHNETDSTYATITVIDSATLVTLSANIAASTEVVSVYSATESVDRLISAERYLLSEQASPATNGIGVTTVNYASGGTDILTITHAPQAALITGMAEAVEAGIAAAHGVGTRPSTSAAAVLPVAILNLSIA